MKRAFLTFVFMAALGVYYSFGQMTKLKLQNKVTGKVINSKAVDKGFDWNGYIVDMPIYNPSQFDAKILVKNFSEEWIYNMPIIGKKEKKGYPLKLDKHLLKQGPANINKNQKDQPTEEK